MQQEATKKNKKLIVLIAILAAVLVVAGGVVGALFLFGGAGEDAPVETGPVGGRPDLYWNVDRLAFTDGGVGMSTREPESDGTYTIRFAYNGEIVEYGIADKRLVNAIDTMDVVGLIKDESGNVIDAVDPATIATEVAKDTFVQKVGEGFLNVNSSVAMNGMETLLQFTELTQVYNVDDTAEIPGQIGEAELLDRVWAFANDKGELTHVYIVDRQPKGEVYYRVDAKNVDSNGNTKREPDENGIYYILMSHKGEQVELKCKDKEIVNEIDSLSTRMSDIALQVDEEGFITGTLDTAIALRGKLLGAGYHITAINGDTISASYMFAGKEAGKSFEITLTENTEIYDMCMSQDTEQIGRKLDELRVDDRFVVYTDLEGNPVYVYVMMHRYAEADIYYNVTRMYDATAKETTRKPDANGYYKALVSIDGKQRTIRTKDKALMSKLDSFSAKIGGVILDGDIIKFVCNDMYVAGHYKYTTGTARILQSQTGVILSFYTAGQSADTIANLVMAPDAGIYDISGRPGTKLGEKTTLKEGDTIRVLADYQNNITHVFVVGSYTGDPVYYNLSRQYDSANDCTKRTPDAEGYYVFEMVKAGKQVTVKTKNKEIADFIDRQSPYYVSLRVSGGIIRDANPASSAYEEGYLACKWGYFQRYNGKKSMNCANSSNEGSTRYKLAEDVKIYNVSTVYSSYRGETTTLKEGDRIACIGLGKTQEIVEIYVITRQVESKVFWNVKRMYSSATGETTREPNSSGYYVFELAVDGQVKRFRTKDKALATRLDKESYAVGLQLSGNTIKSVFSATNIKGISSSVGAKHDVVKISGNKVYLESKCPSNTSFGSTKTVTKASNCKVYDVSEYASKFGASTTLKVGDRVICYTNSKGEATYIFVMNKMSREKGAYSYCEHCGKEVYWQPFENRIYETDCHVYLTHDRDLAAINDMNRTKDVEDRAELVLDLNGKTMGIRRGYFVYSKLNIVDSVGGGKIVTDVENRGSDDNGNGAVLIVTKGGTVNLYGGTITRNATSDPATRGGCIIVGGNSNFNMYGGKVTGGAAETGANIYIGSKTNVQLMGGEIDGDVAVSATSANVTIGGIKINKGTQGGLMLPGGMLLDLSKVTDKTKVCVDAAGIFTETVSNADDYLDNFYSSEDELPISNVDGALAVGKYAACPHCDGEMALFGKFTAAAAAGDTHLIVLDDMTLSTQLKIGADSSNPEDHDDDVVIDLNGKTITLEKGNNTGRLALVYGTLSVMDSSASKTGKIYSNVSDAGNGGMVLMGTGAVAFNLYSGSMVTGPDFEASQGGIISVTKNSTFTMYDGLIAGGNCRADKIGGNVLIGGSGRFVMKGGKIEGGNGLNGGNIYANTGSTVIIEAGTIENGTATNGGNIYINGAGTTLQIKDGVQVLGGTATTAGNGIYLSNHANNVSIAGTVSTGDVVIGGTSASVSVTGAAKIDKLVIPEGGKITADGLSDGAKIKVEATGIFTNELETEAMATEYVTKGYFESLTANAVAASGKALTIGTPVTPPDEPDPEEPVIPSFPVNDSIFDADGNVVVTTCPICGAESVTWTMIESLDSDSDGAADDGNDLVNGGHYYLNNTAKNFTMWGQRIPADATVCVYMPEGVTNYGTFRLNDNSTLNLFGKGTVRIGNGNAILANNVSGAKVNIYGGEVVGNGSASDVKTKYGTGILMVTPAGETPNQLLITNDAKVRHAYSDKTGALIYVENCQMTVSGYAKIYNGTTTAAGGGNIGLKNSTLTISDHVEIHSGKATGANSAAYGGNIHAINSDIVMTGGTIRDGEGGRGGNIMLQDGSSLTMSGTSEEAKAVISNGHSMTHGGNIYAIGESGKAGNTVTVGNFAEISGGFADNKNGHGGNIAMLGHASATSQTLLTINGGEIKNGKAGKQAGNISATAGAKIVMNGGLVADGIAATDNKYNMIVMTGATMDFLGGEVKNGTLAVDSESSLIRLGGNATMTASQLSISTNATVQILAGWSGNASLNCAATEGLTTGEVLPMVKTGNYADGVFTAADVEFTGTMISRYNDGVAVVQATETAEAGDVCLAAPVVTG